MCLPLLAMLAGGALSAGGGLLNRNAEQQQAAEQAAARNAAMDETFKKNDALALQSRDRFAKDAQQYNTPQFDKNAAVATENRTAPLVDAIAKEAPVATPISGDAPDVVKSDLAKTMGAAMAKGRSQAQALGKVGSYGDTWFNAGQGNVDASRDVGVTNDFAQGNLAIMPYLQDYAQIAATHPISPLGGILQGFGNLVGSAGGGMGGGFLQKQAVPKQQVLTGWGGPR